MRVLYSFTLSLQWLVMETVRTCKHMHMSSCRLTHIHTPVELIKVSPGDEVVGERLGVAHTLDT